MFGKFLQQLVASRPDHSTSNEREGGSVVLTAIFSLFAVWASWYVWTFHINPALHPREPQQKPYFIPIIGHAIDFFKDSEGVFTASRKYFQDCRKPFAITVAGQKLYIVTSPRDASRIYKNTTTLSFDEFVRGMMLDIGASEDGVRKMWESPRYHDDNSNRLQKILAHAGEDYYRQQLHPGDHLDALWSTIQARIDESLSWDGIPAACRIEETATTKHLSLLKWCRSTLLSSVTNSVFGVRLLEINPNLLNAFVAFDDDSWKLNYKIPRLFCEEMHSAREEIIGTFGKYFALPKEERKDAAWLVGTLESEMRKIEVPEHDIAALFGMPFWVINSNAYKLCFWIMAYVLSDSTLHASIRAEVDQAIDSSGQLATNGLESRLEECKLLVAVYHEMLRFITASASIRTVAAPTELGDVVLSPGAKVLIPYRQLHFDEAAFGEDAAKFNPSRFLDNVDLSKSPSFRPFGGGTTYCAGRYVARREVLGFVAMSLHRYDIEVHGGIDQNPGEVGGEVQGSSGPRKTESQRFPKCDLTKPSLGVLPPLPGEDLEVVVRERVSKL